MLIHQGCRQDVKIFLERGSKNHFCDSADKIPYFFQVVAGSQVETKGILLRAILIFEHTLIGDHQAMNAKKELRFYFSINWPIFFPIQLKKPS